MEIDQDVRLILQKDQTYVESLISRQNLQSQGTGKLSPEQEEEIETLLNPWRKRMIQDRGQKAQAIRYILAKRWFPQLEVVVLPDK